MLHLLHNSGGYRQCQYLVFWLVLFCSIRNTVQNLSYFSCLKNMKALEHVYFWVWYGCILSDIAVWNLAIMGWSYKCTVWGQKTSLNPLFLENIQKDNWTSFKKNSYTDPCLGTGFALWSPEVGQFNSN